MTTMTRPLEQPIETSQPIRHDELQPEPRSKAPRNSTLALLLVLLLAFGVRAWNLQGQSFSMDELSELSIARLDVAEIVVEPDGFPPLYHLLLHGWLDTFGPDTAARWLSVLLGVATVYVLWKIGHMIAGVAAAVGVATLTALSPFHFFYTQEVRAYSLLLLMAALTLWLFFRALKSDRPRDWAWFALAALGGVYTHYHFVVLVVVTAVVLVVERRSWASFKRGFVVYGSLALLSLPAAWLLRGDLMYQVETGSDTGFGLIPLAYTYETFLAGLTIGPSLRELHTMPAREAIVAILPWAVAIGLAVVVLAYNGFRAMQGTPWPMRLFLLAVLPVLLVGLISTGAGIGYKVRYVSWAAIAIFAWLGTAAARRPMHWPVGIAALLLAVVYASALYSRNYDPRHQNEDVRALSQYLASQSDAKTPIFVISGYMGPPVAYYLDDNRQIVELPHAAADGDDVSGSLETIRTTAADAPFWLVYTREFHADPRGTLRDTLLNQERIQHEQDFAGVVLYRGVAR